MSSTGKIVLFASEGLNPVRLALSVGGVAFDDHHTFDQKLELHVNGEALKEPRAMLRFAGRSYPVQSPLVALLVDEILHVLSEVEAKMDYIVDDADGQREDSQRSIISRYVSQIEARLQRLQAVPGFEVYNGKVLIHEVALYCWVKTLRVTRLDDILKPHDLLIEAESKVENYSGAKWQRNHSNYPKLKLTYFPFPGRAEPIRLALFIGNITFVDERISADELDRRRLTLPFNQLPVLDVDGEVVSQALAILRYVETLTHLYPVNESIQAFRIDEVFSLIDEFYSSYAWNALYFEKDPTKQKKLRATLARNTLPKTLGFLEKRVAQWSGHYAVGESFTVADLAIYSLLWTFKSGRISGVPVTTVEPYKKLLEVYQLVTSHAKVAEWTTNTH
ncbi:unnamed protein product [Phytophthora lilii]|uniref:Unnamed protein product n=1 Tax=Phytophthora lilii TaxID=2077276 RepID=A0A9W6TLM0_9STRA|nr:unnamed protein product [Phytophthora lilii]